MCWGTAWPRLEDAYLPTTAVGGSERKIPAELTARQVRVCRDTISTGGWQGGAAGEVLTLRVADTTELLLTVGSGLGERAVGTDTLPLGENIVFLVDPSLPPSSPVPFISFKHFL